MKPVRQWENLKDMWQPPSSEGPGTWQKRSLKQETCGITGQGVLRTWIQFWFEMFVPQRNKCILVPPNYSTCFGVVGTFVGMTVSHSLLVLIQNLICLESTKQNRCEKQIPCHPWCQILLSWCSHRQNILTPMLYPGSWWHDLLGVGSQWVSTQKATRFLVVKGKTEGKTTNLRHFRFYWSVRCLSKIFISGSVHIISSHSWEEFLHRNRPTRVDIPDAQNTFLHCYTENGEWKRLQNVSVENKDRRFFSEFIKANLLLHH